MGYVAWPVWRPRLAQVPARKPGSESAPPRRRLRRHLLSPSLRPQHAARGDRSARCIPLCSRARRSTSASPRIPTGEPPKQSPSFVRSGRRCSSISRPTRCSIAGSRRDCLMSSAHEGVGCIAFSPLAQGLLTSRYLHGIPEGSRAQQASSLSREMLSDANLNHVRALTAIAERRGQSLAQMALAWALRDPRGHRQCSSARAASLSSRRTLGRSTHLDFSADGARARSISTPSTAVSTCGEVPQAADFRRVLTRRVGALRPCYR